MMTKEMAIRILTGSVLGTYEQTQEAVDMAVNAINRLPEYGCNGCINFDTDPYEFPCWSCARLKIDYYKAEKGDSNG